MPGTSRFHIASVVQEVPFTTALVSHDVVKRLGWKMTGGLFLGVS